MARQFFQSVVRESRNLCSNVKHITFTPQNEGPFEYTPGQFIMIHFPNEEGIELNRSYSISAPPGEHEGFSLCVKRVDFGKGSTLLHKLEVGDEIKTSGPFGRFVLRDEDPEDIILVATGTGIAPFRSMIDQLKTSLDNRRIWMLMGVRHGDELLYHDEWTALDEAHERFHYRAIVSRPRPEDHWTGPVGYVSAFFDELSPHINPGRTTAYLCGVPPMIDDMRERFMAKGMTRREIRTEKFASPPDPKKKKTPGATKKPAQVGFKPRSIQKKQS